ncbi:ATP-binding cassette domain-containing protein, partial [Clostridium chrysemydis]
MLEVKNISKRFNDIKVLENISFTIKNGEIVGLIGPNGSGKSTLMKCILKLLKIDEGEITLNRERIEDYDEQYFS